MPDKKRIIKQKAKSNDRAHRNKYKKQIKIQQEKGEINFQTYAATYFEINLREFEKTSEERIANLIRVQF